MKVQFPGILALVALLFAPWPAQSQQASASSVIEAFHETLISVMKEAKSLGIKGRYERLAKPVTEAFHLRRMLKWTAGKYWKRATPGQRDRLLAAFTRMSVGNYAVNFDGYSGERFVTLGERPVPRNMLLVETQIVRVGDDPVDLTYVMTKFENRWGIGDVLYENISELARRRSEFRRVLKNDGIDGLIASLDAKNRNLLGN
jgi:phospholipid transport system substrate-binding protein